MSAGTVLGRWVSNTGALIRIEPLTDAKCFGRWAGPKGGVAGFEGVISQRGKKIRGEWFSVDDGITDRDRAMFVATLSDDAATLSVKAWGKRNMVTGDLGTPSEWEAKRETLPREGGKITTFAFTKKEVFEKLTANHWENHRAWAEATRTALLEASKQETATSPRRLDGATTYIPPVSLCDPYDDLALRRHASMSRHGGRQLFSSPQVVREDPRLEFMPCEYEDWTQVVRRLRKAGRAKSASAVPASLAGRPKFKPTLTDGMERPETFLSPVTAETAKEELQKLAKIALAPPLSVDAAAAGTLPPGAHASPNLRRGENGRLDVTTAPPNFKAGYPHAVEAYEKGQIAYIPDDYEAKKAAQRAEKLAETAKLMGRPPFRGVSATLDPSLTKVAGHGEDPVPLPPVSPSRPGTSPTKAAGVKEDRPVFRPYMRDYSADPGIGGYPEFVHDPDGGREAMAAACKAKRQALEEAAKGGRLMWRDPSSPSIPSRYVQSIAMHPRVLRTEYLPAVAQGRSVREVIGLSPPSSRPATAAAGLASPVRAPPASPMRPTTAAAGAGHSSNNNNR